MRFLGLVTSKVIRLTYLRGSTTVGSPLLLKQQVLRLAATRGISDYVEMFYKRLCAENMGRKLQVSHDELVDIQHRMAAAIDKGLGTTTHSAASVKCWDAQVDYPMTEARESTTVPRPRVNQFLSLDVSRGTVFRTRFTTVSSLDRVSVKCADHEVQRLRADGGRQLFDRAAEALAMLAAKHNVATAGMPLAFTFAFPVRHVSLGQAVLQRWTKEFYGGDGGGGDIVHTDVVDALRESLARVDVRVGRVAVLNDVTAGLLDAQVVQPNARIGLVVDDGCNCSFVERVANVRGRRVVGTDAAAINTIVNTEWGAFGENGELNDLRTVFDERLDACSLEPGKQVFEKMTSGMYMGELIRYFVMGMVDRGILFRGLGTAAMNTENVLTIEHLFRVESDAQGTYNGAREVLANVLHVYHPTDMDCALFRYAVECITKRSAYLVAAGVASVVQRLQSCDPGIVIDITANGSVFYHHPRYENMMMSKLKSLNPHSGSLLPHCCSVSGAIRVAELLAQVPETF